MNSMNAYMGVKGPTGAIGNKLPKGYKSSQLAQFTPEQMQLFQELFSNVSPGSYLSRLAGGDRSFFEEMEAPALRQFSELQGNIASRFSQGGGGPNALSSRRSSGFQNELSSQASNFAQQLQAQRQQLQKQAIFDLMGLSRDLLGERPYDTKLVPKGPSFMDKWLGLAANTLGAATKSAPGGF